MDNLNMKYHCVCYQSSFDLVVNFCCDASMVASWTRVFHVTAYMVLNQYIKEFALWVLVIGTVIAHLIATINLYYLVVFSYPLHNLSNKCPIGQKILVFIRRSFLCIRIALASFTVDAVPAPGLCALAFAVHASAFSFFHILFYTIGAGVYPAYQ